LWSNTGRAPWPSQFRMVPELSTKLQCSGHIFQSFKYLTHLSKLHSNTVLRICMHVTAKEV
jgi:hypothetical protein